MNRDRRDFQRALRFLFVGFSLDSMRTCNELHYYEPCVPHHISGMYRLGNLYPRISIEARKPLPQVGNRAYQVGLIIEVEGR